ncbi:unnamed protein product [Ranitomeya imitator]|uniref:Ornithine aminotransferase n=1 Tax=Ranitomeya imitator TaxID=111125 RepID=A0ABN9LV45_9NEOB|nr:unnamed protein product [Ranitomeya imitator]
MNRRSDAMGAAILERPRMRRRPGDPEAATRLRPPHVTAPGNAPAHAESGAGRRGRIGSAPELAHTSEPGTRSHAAPLHHQWEYLPALTLMDAGNPPDSAPCCEHHRRAIQQGPPWCLQGSPHRPRLKEKHILLSADGPHRNVLKFKPPMCFTKEDAKMVVDIIDELLTAFEEATGTNKAIANEQSGNKRKDAHETSNNLQGNVCRTQESGLHSENHAVSNKRIRT